MWTRHGVIYAPVGDNIWSQTHATMPVVLDMGDRWRIYYSTRDLIPKSYASFFDVVPSNPHRILYQHSKPILDLGPLGSPDEMGTMPCWVQKSKKGEIFLYYIGWSIKHSVPFDNCTCLASSQDGVNFTKIGPVLGSHRHDPYFTGTIAVLPDAGLWRGYYMSGTGWERQWDDKKPEPSYILKYAESWDGIDWHREGKVVINFKNTVERGIMKAWATKDKDVYKMWYSYRNGGNYRDSNRDGYRIGYAESTDGESFTRIDDERGLLPSGMDWESTMVHSPHIIDDGNTRFMFYNGNSFGRTGIGYATAPI